MGKLNFREWLEERGLLAGYLRNRLAYLEYDWWPYEVLILDPYKWTNHAFKWAGTPEGHCFWEGVNGRWDAVLRRFQAPDRGAGRFEYGLPMDDKLGITLILAGLEGGYEKS